MNNLTLAIYLAGVVDGVRDMIVLLAVFMVIVFVALVIWSVAIGCNPHDEDVPNSFHWYRKTIYALVATFFLWSALDILVPTRQTLILMAGSEMGEKLVKSEAVGSVVNPGLELIRTWIQKETKDLVDPPKK
jgi:hypothetical protein